jgi:hypothetical protein
VKVEANDIWRKEVHRLTKHGSLSLDSANAPSHNAKTVNHRRVRVSSDQRIREIDTITLKRSLREILKVYLVTDTETWRNNTERFERLLAPLQELVARLIALELGLHIELKRVVSIVEIHLYGVIDHKINWHKRFNHPWGLLKALYSRTHGGEIHTEGNAGKILQENARHNEGNLRGSLPVWLPCGEFSHVSLLNSCAVTITQNRLKDDSNGNWES